MNCQSCPPLSPRSNNTSLNHHQHLSFSSFDSPTGSCPSSTGSSLPSAGSPTSSSLASTASPTGCIPTPLLLSDPSTLLAMMEGEDLEPPHSPLDVSTPLTVDGMTALHLAAQGNNWHSVPMLVRCGANVSAEDDEGRTPTYLALLYACTPAAAALLAFPQSLEHTTKDGCNYLHAALKSCESECVEMVLQQLSATSDGVGLLQRLTSSPDHHGTTPLALALASPDTGMLAALYHAGLDVSALISHSPALLRLASSPALSFLASMGGSEVTCAVWLEGINFSQAAFGDEESESEEGLVQEGESERECEKGERWAVGSVRVTPATLWTALEDTLTSLALHHWDALARQGYNNSSSSSGASSSSSSSSSSSRSRGERRRSDPLQDCEVTPLCLGLNKASITHFSIGHHKWTRGEYGLVSGPYDLLVNNGSQDVCIHLHPLQAAAYSLLLPLPTLKNYLRLSSQCACVVVYGARDSGKRSLVRCLAHLKAGGRGQGVLCLDLGGEGASVGGGVLERVRGVVESGGGPVVLERVGREIWPEVWAAVQGASAGMVLATMDAWRRPGGGQLEGGVLWVQLRHDREPLSSTLNRCLTRHFASLHAGLPPSPASEIRRTLEWAAGAWGRLAATLMSLGFSSALHGPRLLARALANAVSPNDILRGVCEVWNGVVSSEICGEVVGVWRRSNMARGEADEARVVNMALYVVIQRSLAPGLPLPPPEANAYLSSLDGGLGRSAFRSVKSSIPSARFGEFPSKPSTMQSDLSSIPPARLNDLSIIPSRPNDLSNVPSRLNDLSSIPSRPNDLSNIPTRPNDPHNIPSRPNDLANISSRPPDLPSALQGDQLSSSRPKDLPLRGEGPHQHHHLPVPNIGLASPTSPDWDEASLTKILGLSPVGYA